MTGSLPFRASIWIHVAFVLTGVVNTLLGPILPGLAARWSLQHSEAGFLFAAQFSGAIIGALLFSRWASRWGYPITLVVGLVCMAAGVAALALGEWPHVLIAVCGFGVGLGFTIPAANLLIAETSDRAAGAVSLLNVAWGLGAVMWPPLVAVAHAANAVASFANTDFLLLALAGTVAISAGVVLYLLGAWNHTATLTASAAAATSGRARKPTVALLGLLFFLYVGTETALAGWSAAYARSLSVSASSAWTLTPAFFWAPLLIGRLLAPTILRKASEAVVFRSGLSLVLIGVGLLQVATQPSAVIGAVSLAGLGSASIFPILIAWLSRAFGQTAARIGGVMFALCGLGGATIPWLVGAVSFHFASMRAGLTVILVSTALLLAVELTTRVVSGPWHAHQAHKR